jgi:hypothetical protein
MDPRFQEYIECTHKGRQGFRLPGCPHFFEYLPDGGWHDEQGRRFNQLG